MTCFLYSFKIDWFSSVRDESLGQFHNELNEIEWPGFIAMFCLVVCLIARWNHLICLLFNNNLCHLNWKWRLTDWKEST